VGIYNAKIKLHGASGGKSWRRCKLCKNEKLKITAEVEDTQENKERRTHLQKGDTWSSLTTKPFHEVVLPWP